MHRNDILALVTLLVGVASLAADSTFSGELTALFGVYTPKILAVLGLLGMVGSQVIRVLSVPTQAAPPQKGP
jgi:hypothetical protein